MLWLHIMGRLLAAHLRGLPGQALPLQDLELPPILDMPAITTITWHFMVPTLLQLLQDMLGMAQGLEQDHIPSYQHILHQDNKLYII